MKNAVNGKQIATGPAAMRGRLFAGLLTTSLLAPAIVCSPPKANFSGTWKQSNEQCVPKRTGDVVRHVVHRGSDLIVETTVRRSSGVPRNAVQRYSIDGHPSVSTGADGDEFHTAIVWKDESLLFSIEEHEDGRILRSKETWTLLEHGSELQVERQSLDGPGNAKPKQTLLFLRQQPDATGH